MSSLRMSIGDILIYVLVSLMFNNVHFRHFGFLKMQFLIIRQMGLIKSMILDILVLGLEISSKTSSFSL